MDDGELKEIEARDDPASGREPEGPAADQSSAPEATGDEDVPSEPVDPRAAREMYGDDFDDTTTYGPAQFGRANTQHNYFGERSLDPIIGLLPGIEDLLEIYVAAGSDGDLDERIASRSTVCLVGPRKSGRFSAARAALARRYKPDDIYEIALPANVRPEALNRKPECLAEESGFVLRLTGDGHADAIRTLANLFRSRRSTLVLIKDGHLGRWDRTDAEVPHRMPDPIEVFRRHLAAALRTSCADEVERFLTSRVRRELTSVYGPRESVAIARAIAQERPADDEKMEELLERSQPGRRTRATEILLSAGEDSTVRSRRARQHERAFRLAYAVFYRKSLHYVFEGAERLLREIDSAALRPEWGSMALQDSVGTLLGDTLGEDWRAGRHADAAARNGSRVAWIRDRGLPKAILDVAWHEFDGTRRPLLKWLDHLVADGDDVMRQAAAEAAGMLLNHDFARVHLDLTGKWAASPKPAVRQAAALTMTLVDMAGDVGHQVRRKLSEWCNGNNNYRRDTAARLYASGLEQDLLEWSMFDLARIAEDAIQKRFHTVARAVNQLYRPDRAKWIVDELALWAGVKPLRLHAARALLALTRRVEATASDGRPELLQRLGEKNVDVNQLGHLWLVAFVEPETAAPAAERLASWIGHADSHPDLRRAMAGLLESIAPEWRRVDFYLKRTSAFGDGLPEWASERKRVS
ncbi:hypothetical protein [Actinoplanes sp. NPDC048796]|uniref:hypothetical protein n=1 Tax=Actinoplanes sp. NPDC048796 TaxID=3155640 RepID=UPI0033F01420